MRRCVGQMFHTHFSRVAKKTRLDGAPGSETVLSVANNFEILYGLCPLHDTVCASRAEGLRRQSLCYERIEDQDGCGAIKDRELVSIRALELQGTSCRNTEFFQFIRYSTQHVKDF